MRFVKSPASPQKFLRIGAAKSASAPAAPAIITDTSKLSLLGKAVFFQHEGERVAGRVKAVADGDLVVSLAVPSRSGLLMVTEAEITVKATDTEVTNALLDQRKVAAFEAGANLALDNKFVTLFEKDSAGKDTTVIADYRDLTIEGMASTFGTPDKRDRGGDYVLPGAWDKTLTEFKTNPVILTDHKNTTTALAGSWSNVSVNQKGLGVIGKISNAPGLRDLRFKLAEGHLKGLSIGGIWFYGKDGFGIEDIDLFEISIVAVPMNAECLVHTRSLGVADCRKAFSKFWRSNTELRMAA